MVDGRDLVMEDVVVAVVEIDALLDDRLVVLVQGKPGRFENAGAGEIAGFNLEQVVAAAPEVADPKEPPEPEVGGKLVSPR